MVRKQILQPREFSRKSILEKEKSKSIFVFGLHSLSNVNIQHIKTETSKASTQGVLDLSKKEKNIIHVKNAGSFISATAIYKERDPILRCNFLT